MVQAIAAGKLLGKHDCYVLADGRRVLSAAAVARILGTREGHDTARSVAIAIASLASLDASFGRSMLVAFEVAPGKPIAGIEARRFSKFCVAASQALAEGKLARAQEPVGRAARRFLERLALAGVSSMRSAADKKRAGDTRLSAVPPAA